MALGSTESLTEMSTRVFPKWRGVGKGGRCEGMSTFSFLCDSSLDILEASNSWSPKDLTRFVIGWLFILK